MGTQWFVEPLDMRTNEIIAQALAKKCRADVVDLCLVDDEGKEHQVYMVDFPFINFLRKSRITHSLNYRIFDRAGISGIARNSRRFLGKKKKPKMKKGRE